MKKTSEWIDAVREIAAETEKTFKNLTENEINWKPELNQWSIGQCFDHLMITNKAYFPCINELIEGKCEESLWKKFPMVTNFLGKAMVDSLHPESTRKLDAPQKFWPSEEKLPTSIITDFLSHQQELIQLIERSESINKRKAIFCSPVARFVTFTLEDGFNMLIYHEQRHLQQALNILEEKHLEETEPQKYSTKEMLDASANPDFKLQA